MTIPDLYRLVEALLPPWLIAALGLFVIISSIAHAYLRREPRAIVFVAGGISFTVVYGWIHLSAPTYIQRAVATRIAVALLLLAIAIYNERAWPWLSKFLKQTLDKLWGRG